MVRKVEVIIAPRERVSLRRSTEIVEGPLCALPDGRFAFGWDTTIRLWDPNTGAEAACLQAHSSRVAALCALPDGRLASGSWDHTIRLWDPTTGAETANLETDAPINSITALSATRLVAGDAFGRLHWLEVVD